MRLDRDATRLLVRRTNVERYRRMLKTHLTITERLFVERRLAEEEVALQQIARNVAPTNTSSSLHN
jgi:hypothetical protein